MADKTKAQRLEELETEVKTLRTLVDSLQALMQMHTMTGHVLPTAPVSPPWPAPSPIWTYLPKTVTTTNPS